MPYDNWWEIPSFLLKMHPNREHLKYKNSFGTSDRRTKMFIWLISIIRSSHSEVFCRNDFLKHSSKFRRKHLVCVHFKCSCKPRAATWLKKDSMTAFFRFCRKPVNRYSEIISVTQVKLLYNLTAILRGVSRI